MSQASIDRRVKAVFDSHFDKHCTLICATTHIRSATTWKPGSTLLVIMPAWSPYICARHHDDLGRWCSVTLIVHDQRQIVFYSFYNCCKTQITHAGIHTVFAQQWHVLRQRGDQAPDPRLQAVNDLAAELVSHKRHDRSICILGDCNEDIGMEPALMATICSSNDLVDVMDTLHPNNADIPSYARSPNHLDYGLVSANLAPYLAGAGLNHYHEFTPLITVPFSFDSTADSLDPYPRWHHSKSDTFIATRRWSVPSSPPRPSTPS
jgi:hypothetical protein